MKHAREDYDLRIQDADGLIPIDEPVFLLRAQDQLAPGLLREWAKRLLNCEGDPRTVARVRAHADAMERWQDRNGFKIPDTPEPATPAEPEGGEQNG